MNCLSNLIGMKGNCNSEVAYPFYVDDIEGITEQRLSELATIRDGNSEGLFKSIRDSSVRIMLADIDSLIPTNYRIVNELASVCSTCT